MTTTTEGVDYGLKTLSWDLETVVTQRNQYLSPSLTTFMAYEKPLLLKKGEGQYLWDAEGRRYLDCLAQNLCISVGHSHPLVIEEVKRQIDELQHCTTMWAHPAPGALAEALVEHLPPTADWVVHFVNSGAEAVDLALLLARVFTGRPDIVALRRAYHGLHFGAMTATGLSICHQPVPAAPGILHVSNPDVYQGIHGGNIDGYLSDISAVIESSTPGEVAGFLFEPIQVSVVSFLYL